MRFATTGVLPWMRIFLLLDIRNLIQHSSRAAYDSGHSPENLLGPFFFFSLSSIALWVETLHGTRDLAFWVWENSPPPPAFLCQFGGNFALGFYSLLLLLLLLLPLLFLLLHLVHMVSFQLEQSTILLASYRIGSTDDMMADVCCIFRESFTPMGMGPKVA